MEVSIMYANIPDKTQGIDRIRVDPDASFGDVIATLVREGRLEAPGQTRTVVRNGKQTQVITEYFFKHIGKDGNTGEIIQDANSKLSDYNVAQGDELKVFVRETLADFA